MTDLSFANEQVEHPPAYENAADGLAGLDTIREAELAEMQSEVAARMEQMAQDPRQQSYFMRMDSKTLVRDEKEYMHCLEARVQMKIVPYGHAIQLLAEEDARKTTRAKDKRKKKAVKASRKRNR